jgi:3-isopropylmalate dehydrogenase
MEKNLAILAGDGIGPEVTAEALRVLDAIEEKFGHQFTRKEGLVGAAAIDATGHPFPPETERLCRNAEAILFGAIGDPRYDNDPNAKVRPEQGLLQMRKTLGLYANVRPVKSYPLLHAISPLKNHIIKDVDFVVFRELTSGIYFGEPRGRSEDGNKAFDTMLYTRDEITRVAKMAFETAQSRRKKLTLVDKANVLASSRLWRETLRSMQGDYPDVELDFMFVDNAAMKIIQQPAYFDVVLTGNMFGDIITDAASVIPGSLGMLPSASIGSTVGMFEPIHGSYPEAAGKDKANPLAAILSLAMLLRYSFDAHEESDTIERAVDQVLAKAYVTEDLNRDEPRTTSEVGERVAHYVKSS